MKSQSVRWVACLILAAGWLGGPAAAQNSEESGPILSLGPPTGGELRILAPDGTLAGVCPLKHSDVEANIVGYVAGVRVRQTFTNSTDRKIEAIYVFPLPHESAVDNMTMIIGDRRIVAQIKPREEAQAVYQAARAAGQVASLLDQERPNIFTQSVTNIEPGMEVVIEISYLDTLRMQDDGYQFVFPMVVGPRYIPPGQVPDASRITPPITPEGTRAGHDISLAVTIDAPVGINDIQSVLHEVQTDVPAPGLVRVTLKNKNEIPNKDFILNYRPSLPDVSNRFYVHRDDRGEFFTLLLQPPARVAPQQAVPKEMIFVIDRSGSMRGAPLEKAKAAMKLCIEGMNPNDTFNLLSFSNTVEDYMGGSVPNTPENRALALEKLAALEGGGGTNMVPSLQQALGGERDSDRVRIVCFITDGKVGNEADVLETVQTNIERGRLFAFGVGNSVNRYLLEKMAEVGRGDVEFVTLTDAADPAAQRFAARIQSPVLTDIRIDWGDLAVEEVYPDHVPDVFSRTPIMVHGRLKGMAGGTITLHGQTAAGSYEQRIAVLPTQDRTPHEIIPTLWARAKVEDLMLMQPVGRGDPTLAGQIRDEIVSVGVKYRLMTQYTSFVAVEEMRVTVAGEPMTIAVPVEMPEGVSYEGVFGTESGQSMGYGLMSRQGAAYGAFYSLNGALGIDGGGGSGGGRGGRGGRAGRGGGAQALGESESLDELRRRSLASGVARQQAQPIFAPTPRPLTEQGRSAARSGALFDYDGDANTLIVTTDDTRWGDMVASPTLKLTEPLRTLAAQVERDGREGNLTVGALKVVAYKIDVMVTLHDLSDETLKALADLGFVKTAESRATRLLVGAIDVRKLEDLAKLEAVRRVEPVAR